MLLLLQFKWTLGQLYRSSHLGVKPLTFKQPLGLHLLFYRRTEVSASVA